LSQGNKIVYFLKFLLFELGIYGKSFIKFRNNHKMKKKKKKREREGEREREKDNLL
jgi:hypothetical protein